MVEFLQAVSLDDPSGFVPSAEVLCPALILGITFTRIH